MKEEKGIENVTWLNHFIGAPMMVDLIKELYLHQYIITQGKINIIWLLFFLKKAVPICFGVKWVRAFPTTKQKKWSLCAFCNIQQKVSDWFRALLKENVERMLIFAVVASPNMEIWISKLVFPVKSFRGMSALWIRQLHAGMDNPHPSSACCLLARVSKGRVRKSRWCLSLCNQSGVWFSSIITLWMRELHCRLNWHLIPATW